MIAMFSQVQAQHPFYVGAYGFSPEWDQAAGVTHTFKLPDACEVKLTVHDILGREVAVLKQGPLGRGVHSAVFHAGRMLPGMYLYRLQAGAEVLTGRMVIMR